MSEVINVAYESLEVTGEELSCWNFVPLADAALHLPNIAIIVLPREKPDAERNQKDRDTKQQKLFAVTRRAKSCKILRIL